MDFIFQKIIYEKLQNIIKTRKKELCQTRHFVPEGISTSMRDFITLALILKFFIYSFLDKRNNCI